MLINKQATLTGVLTLEGTDVVDHAHFEHNDERVMSHHLHAIKVIAIKILQIFV